MTCPKQDFSQNTELEVYNMNVLFLSLTYCDTLKAHNIYTDLLREFEKQGHSVYAVCPVQRRLNKPTQLIKEGNASIIQVRTGNITKTNVIEKGLSTLMIGHQFVKAIKKLCNGIKFDLILYPTPPITLESVVRYFKKRDGAETYLMLKDIFPQNAVDIGMMQKGGVRGILYRYFRRKEKRLYDVSDRIGCMSQANVDYVLKHNTEIDAKKVEICPNSIEITDMSISDIARRKIRAKYNIPENKKVFVYGGNLGKPQGIPFIIDCLRSQNMNPDAFFLIVGDGTEYSKLDAFINEYKPANVRLMKRLPKEDYDTMVAACDVGMIFLDHRFTIPNFPSRLLSYMQAGLPVLACTDPNTDVGKVIEDEGFGWWCESNSVEAFLNSVNLAITDIGSNSAKLRENAARCLAEKYNVSSVYHTIVK